MNLYHASGFGLESHNISKIQEKRKKNIIYYIPTMCWAQRNILYTNHHMCKQFKNSNKACSVAIRKKGEKIYVQRTISKHPVKQTYTHSEDNGKSKGKRKLIKCICLYVNKIFWEIFKKIKNIIWFQERELGSMDSLRRRLSPVHTLVYFESWNVWMLPYSNNNKKS